MKLSKKWKVFLIHHSHTDIGYTERQDKIIHYHCDFIKQAVDILREIDRTGNEARQGFVWQCENHWQVKNFYDHAPSDYITDFEKYVREGRIGLSGNYLNLTELVSRDILYDCTIQAKKYGEQIGYPIRSGMSADINGFAWGYADVLQECGVERLFSCLHPHHGMFPLYKKQTPFYWQGPSGKKVLVWNGEHYHFGNELCFSPHAASTYMIFDEISKKMRGNQLFTTSPEDTEQTELAILDERLERYLQNLEAEGYPGDFVPFMVSGAITDNAPPNVKIAERVDLLNRKYAGTLEVRMVTLDQFFDRLEAEWKDIPVYQGDWNDWWADGVGSTPAVVKVYREGQRKYDLCKKLDPDSTLGDAGLMQKAAENLILYSEHTWGYSSSVSEPWETLVGELEHKKSAYAINGNTEVADNLDRILAKKGEVAIRQDRPQHYRIINPHDIPLETTAKIYIEFWEYVDGLNYSLDVPIEVFDLATNEVIPHQVKRIARAYEIEIPLKVQPKEERNVGVRATGRYPNGTSQSHAHIGAEGVEDVLQPGVLREDVACVETAFYRVEFDQKRGITSIIDRKTGKNLVRQDAIYAPFSGIYEVTDIRTSPTEERRRMGRNRKSPATRRYEAHLTDIQIVESGPLFVSLQLDYSLEGTRFYKVFLKLYREINKIEAMVRIHKDSVWEPENLYVSLPFTAGDDEVKYVDKTGCILRPGIDQLPGSNMEFYLIQNGLVMETGERQVLVAVKDTPLLTFGPLEAKPIQLCDGNNWELNRGETFAWVMNNYWETNFKVDLGGFYEFAFTLSSQEKQTTEAAMRLCEAYNEGLLAFYI